LAGAADDIHRLIGESLAGGSDKQAAKSAILHGIAQGLASRKSPFKISDEDQQLLVKTFFDDPSPEIREASLRLLKVNGITDPSFKTASINKAWAIMGDSTEADEKRAGAIKFIALGDPAHYANNLEKLINTGKKFRFNCRRTNAEPGKRNCDK
jgi:hypothetical protein